MAAKEAAKILSQAMANPTFRAELLVRLKAGEAHLRNGLKATSPAVMKRADEFNKLAELISKWE